MFSRATRSIVALDLKGAQILHKELEKEYSRTTTRKAHPELDPRTLEIDGSSHGKLVQKCFGFIALPRRGELPT